MSELHGRQGDRRTTSIAPSFTTVTSRQGGQQLSAFRWPPGLPSGSPGWMASPASQPGPVAEEGEAAGASGAPFHYVDGHLSSTGLRGGSSGRDRLKDSSRVDAGTRAPDLALSSFMSPVFHFTAHDSAIVAMEHNNHSKLLAVSTSKKELFVTHTLQMPVILNSGVRDAENVFGPSAAPPVDERLLEWDPAVHTALVDRWPYPCTQVQWAPWQHGVFLLGVCPRKEFRLYRFAHERWVLDGRMPALTCSAVAFSPFFTLACACDGGRVELLLRKPVPSAEDEETWTVCSSMGAGGAMEEEREHAAVGDGDARLQSTAADCTCIGWEEAGSLLAVGDRGGVTRVYAVADRGKKLQHLLYRSDPHERDEGCRCLAWAPESGRSFVALAVVHSTSITLLLFRRPRHSSGNELPASLQRLASVSASCAEISKFSWNTTGTRLVTSHTDSSVNVWAMHVSYERQPVCGGAGPLSAPCEGHQDASRERGQQVAAEGISVRAAKSRSPSAAVRRQKPSPLSLCVTLRLVSSVHPYHGSSTAPTV